MPLEPQERNLDITTFTTTDESLRCKEFDFQISVDQRMLNQCSPLIDEMRCALLETAPRAKSQSRARLRVLPVQSMLCHCVSMS